MVTKENILPVGVGHHASNGVQSANHDRVHEIYGVYPTMGFKPHNAFYPIDTGYISEEASHGRPLRIA
jgi:hypothetical protein